MRHIVVPDDPKAAARLLLGQILLGLIERSIKLSTAPESEYACAMDFPLLDRAISGIEAAANTAPDLTREEILRHLNTIRIQAGIPLRQDRTQHAGQPSE